MFVLRDICKSYGGRMALKPTTAEIPTIGITTVLGPSGSGKSTLLRLLGFSETPDSGEVVLRLDSHTTLTRDSTPWPTITSVFQRQFLWPHLTLAENIFLPVKLVAGLEVANARLSDAVDRLKMWDFVDRYPNEVSGGQAQRA